MRIPMLRFRPHHFLCALGYQGKGYSIQFTANMDAIVLGQLRNPEQADTLIEVIGISDDICAPCPHRRGEACDEQSKIAALDRRHAGHLDLHEGEVVSWHTLRERIKQRVKPADLDALCMGCAWLEAGMCKQAVADLAEE